MRNKCTPVPLHPIAEQCQGKVPVWLHYWQQEHVLL
jgi:hypothetical protein